MFLFYFENLEVCERGIDSRHNDRNSFGVIGSYDVFCLCFLGGFIRCSPSDCYSGDGGCQLVEDLKYLLTYKTHFLLAAKVKAFPALFNQ